MDQALFVIKEYILIPFGFVALLLSFIKKLFPLNKGYTDNLDLLSTKLITYISILFFVLWTKSMVTDLFFTDNIYESSALRERFFGPYSYGLWLQPLFWFLFSQSFRISRIQKSVILKLLFSLSFIFTFEKLVIILTSMHRDFLPNSWNVVSFDELYCLVFLIKISLYLCFILAIKYLKSIFK